MCVVSDVVMTSLENSMVAIFCLYVFQLSGQLGSCGMTAFDRHGYGLKHYVVRLAQMLLQFPHGGNVGLVCSFAL